MMATEWRFEENKKCTNGKCPKATTNKEITIKDKAQRQIRTLLNEISTQEWMAILKGKEEEEEIIVEELYIPEQETEAAHISLTTKGDIEANEQQGIGWIHSHNNMATFFSENDINTASQNRISIVVNNKQEMKALIKEKLPCGEEALIEIPVKQTYLYDKETLKAIKEKIKEKAKEIKTTTEERLSKWAKKQERETCTYCKQKIGRGKEEYWFNEPYHESCKEIVKQRMGYDYYTTGEEEKGYKDYVTYEDII